MLFSNISIQVRATHRMIALTSAALLVAFAFNSTPLAGENPTTQEARPFARVFLALKGCTSCAACRSAIRQMVKGKADGGKVALPGDAVEIRYDKPDTIPLSDVVRGLARNRLHNLELVDVLFEADGKITSDSDGATHFAISETGQEYQFSFGDAIIKPRVGDTIRLQAVVQGWREDKGELSLELKTFTASD